MCLDGVDVGGGQVRVGQGLADDPFLGGAVGCGEAVGGAVLVDGGTADDGQYLVAVAAGVGEPLDEQQADALAPAGAVRARGEGLAAPVRRQTPLPRELHEHAGRRHHGRTAGQRQAGLARAQGADRQVQRDQRGRAGGVGGDRRSEQPELVGDPAGHDARRAAGQDTALDGLRCLVHPRAVLQRGGADEDARTGAAQRVRVDPGPLHGLPRRLQEQPLLRVHGQRLARRDAEEVGVELARVVQESAVPHRAAAGAVGVGVVEVVGPAAVHGELGDRVTALRHELPQLRRGGDPAGEAAGHAHDRDRFAGVGGPDELLPGLRLVRRVRQPRGEERGQLPRGGVVEEQAAGQGQSGGLGEGGAQFRGHQRGEPELLERDARIEPFAVPVLQDGGDMARHQVLGVPQALGPAGRHGRDAGRRGR
ncbi:hypothetical protein SLI_6666 [Streptomyces lividans 1326]|uniref:Uncharacterized protein n=1 Tax=Streptomyces lividans 1326 TaxID=1200984 RepID=A0A7U9DWB2_STRLI|nr:hypothetical protein SLI_6666 [Streptomyces lividans 1326]